jgi:hypothetical protein
MEKWGPVLFLIVVFLTAISKSQLTALRARSVFTSTGGRVLNLLFSGASDIEYTDADFPVRFETSVGDWFKRTRNCSLKQPNDRSALILRSFLIDCRLRATIH